MENKIEKTLRSLIVILWVISIVLSIMILYLDYSYPNFRDLILTCLLSTTLVYVALIRC